ncbi:flagellar export chaperone FliS [Brevibacillus agri]|uniref:flagellar export chaperone FliS n=1 Tax=Brevibacillus agri TaxID=51101 RepID=UPI00286FE08F|nr:flagellar export chaperone FliS [Brevibacillus agri]MDR9507290.1 flagellar export chaperone FliS [Brevibacillus agri]
MSNLLQQNAYLRNSIDTAQPAQLLIMLYDGAIKFAKLTIEAIKENKIAEAHNYNLRVQNIIEELMSTLNHDYEISKQLHSLYEFYLHLLITANMTKDIAPIQEFLAQFTELRNSWLQASKVARSNG